MIEKAHIVVGVAATINILNINKIHLTFMK
ncbi:hypothetical protein WY13_02508 [Clostridium ljungdahlii]|uniref:Uncharacterized protein n=1 Tax=Clostridium ljungdahlii TaxID=1538 RepID=A0A168N4S7_9CLOT|nr:hypothetical protein WY13_02508 [Clostridium ljungdahlii]